MSEIEPLRALVHILTDALESIREPVFPFVIRAEDSVIRVYYHFDLNNAIMKLPVDECAIAVVRFSGKHDTYDHKGYIRDFLRDVMDIQVNNRYMYYINIHHAGGHTNYNSLSVGHMTGRSGEPLYYAHMVNIHRVAQYPQPEMETALRLIQEIHKLGMLRVLIDST